MDVELRALRDLMSEVVTSVWVDDVEVHKKVTKFVSQLMPKYKQNIILYEEPKPLFEYNVELEISQSVDRKIWLKSGGYIVIDEAEALVVIDVNTGRFLGKRLGRHHFKNEFRICQRDCSSIKNTKLWRDYYHRLY